MPVLTDVLAGSLAQAANVQQVIDALKGTPSKGVPIAATALNDANNYALTVRNNDPTNSRALSVLKSDGTSLITADVTGVTLGTPLNLPVGSLPISAIANGSITTAKLASNAVTNAAGYAAAAGGSTTSTSMVAIPAMTLTFDATPGGDIIVWYSIPLFNATAANACSVGIKLDSGSVQASAFVNLGGSQFTSQVSGVVIFTGQGGGTHTVAGYWSTVAGTLTQQNAAQTSMVVLVRKN